MNRLSNIFWPLSTIPKNAIIKNETITSKSQKLLLDLGLIKPTGNGSFYLLPIIQKSIDKCIHLIDHHMNDINAQKLTLPILTSLSLWKKSGRWESNQSEFFTLKDRHDKSFILSPTHEEAITSLIAISSPITYKQLPLKLYQIGWKFRDEFKSRFGLIRSKEFLMKDLYSFDINLEAAEITYNHVHKIYENLLNLLELPWVKVNGSSGIMGGTISHEYHIPSKIGEDTLINCTNCSFASNSELLKSTYSDLKCPNCENHSLIETKGIEICHTFLLKDKYSKPLKAVFIKPNGATEFLSMGCYGIGITRLIAAALEILSTENEIRWPNLLAPYNICIIPPKRGSKEEIHGEKWLTEIWNNLKNNYKTDDILIDDRLDLTIGKRLMDCRKLGFPIIIIIGSKIMDNIPKFEIHCLKNNVKKELEFSNLFEEIKSQMKLK